MDWNIQSRARACGECHRAFEDEEALHTLLFSGAEAYERLDVCVDCWTNRLADGANHRRGFISHWQTVYRKPRKEPEVIQRASAETLLRELLERGDPAYAPACFVLAVMLERKRLLKAQGRSRDGDRVVLHYEHAKSGDVYHVVDPQLRLDQLETVQRQVADLLERGLSRDQPAAAEAEAEANPASAEAASPGAPEAVPEAAAETSPAGPSAA